MSTLRRVAIIGGNRIPFARSNGAYAKASNIDMLTAALDGLVARYKLDGERLGEVAAGAVLKLSRDFNMTRESVLNTRLAPETPACDMQQACGTGLQAINYIANKIATGQIEVGIGGGVDTTSDAPIGVSDALRGFLLDLSRAKDTNARLKLLGKFRPSMLGLEIPRNGEPRTGLAMGDHQAITTAEWGIAREAQDELAYLSHKNMAAAYERGFFAEALRHVLRQDPDVIMVGEVRDAETAQQAVQAALTGHLVLTTLHTNDTVGAVARLRDLGVPAFLIAATLAGVVAQRLVRQVCPSCAEDVPLTADQVASLNHLYSRKIINILVRVGGHHDSAKMKPGLYNIAGRPHFSGGSGRKQADGAPANYADIKYF